MLLDQLLRPFGYLAIRHPYKWIVDWLYPVMFTVLILWFMGAYNGFRGVMGSDGVISLVLSFIQSLPGFYIAALAAIATFGRADIDSVLPEPTPKIWIKFRGSENLVSLTRRRFLAMLFAFLTAESLLLIVYSIFLISYGTGLVGTSFYRVSLDSVIGVSLIGIYFLLLCQMVISTFWGLYYLGYKLHE
ncbi:hypothetical protein SAMN05216588_115101 [Pseudomonas flavescens]|uniref:Uncharacterized protein n=1 Tax=Phytopseudomonas flavescens TaxID=29435 RepID=A0A1G8JYE5_9GAMM|nr:hypothetical protein [Pseudomonas flavescens]SDI36242.1 hypothetical protein SAMN05216588_115101 [Pseudomonas flavescens]